MEWKLVTALTLVLFTIPGIAVGTAVAQGFSPAHAPASLTIRTYNNYGVPADDLRAARMHVDGSFREAGIVLSWLDCWYRDKEPANTPAQCRQPLGANELTLRLQGPNLSSGKRYVSMGFSLVNLGEAVPFLATIFVDLVASISASAAVDFGLLLGRAIAHEIGHLLLDTTRHADHGLMRADWSRAELQRNSAADWAFRDTEIATMQRAATSRNVRLMASNP
jgi:hypothetical protein